MGEIEQVDQKLQILRRQHVIPVPVQRNRRGFPIHHPRHLAAHHRQPCLLETRQVATHRFPAHHHAVFPFEAIQNILLRQRMVLVRLPQEHLHNADDGHLAARFDFRHKITSVSFGNRWSVVGGRGAFDCFLIARSQELGACKPLARDARRYKVANYGNKSFRHLVGRAYKLPAPSSKL